MTSIDGSKCSCGREVYPARRICPDCQKPMAAWQLPGRGVVDSWTTIEVPPEGFEAPLHVALVRIAEGENGTAPVRVIARVRRQVATGQAVKLRPEGDVMWAELT